MRKGIARTLYAMLAVIAVAACAPVEQEHFAEVCDDAANPDCAPDRKVTVEE